MNWPQVHTFTQLFNIVLEILVNTIIQKEETQYLYWKGGKIIITANETKLRESIKNYLKLQKLHKEVAYKITMQKKITFIYKNKQHVRYSISNNHEER